MNDYILVQMIFTLLFNYGLLKLFIENAHKLGLMDIPKDRSSHTIPIPRGAGIVFCFILISNILFFYWTSKEHIQCSYVLISLLIIYVLGAVDDIRSVSIKIKLIFMIFISLIAYYDGFVIHSLGNYFGFEFTLGYFALPITVLFLVGFTNALNLSDGLDGLAVSLTIIISSSLFYIGYINNDKLLITLPLLIIVTLIPFLFLNWHPAKIFMGDSGSLFLGLLLALLIVHALKYINPSAILFLGAIPLLDTLLVMERRREKKKPIFTADKNHLHHLLLQLKQNQVFAVLTLIKLQLIFTLIFLQVYNKSDFINVLLFIFLFFIFLKLFDPEIVKKTS